MRALSWIAGGFFALILLAVATAWLVPPLLDLSRYRAEVASLASQQLDRVVRIDGPVTLELLPQPTLTASGVHLDEDADGASVGVDELRLRVGIGALLAGRIDAQELVLRGLDVRLPWPIDAPINGMRAPHWLSSLSARVENGRLSVGGVVVTDIDATLATGDFTGTYQAAGTVTLSGRPWTFTTRLTQPGADGSAGLDLTLDGRGPVQGIGATLSGQLRGDGTLGGRMTARGPDLAKLLPAPHVPFNAEGRISVAGGLAAADDLSVVMGGSPARGAVALRLSPTPRLDVALAASRLDLDAWLPTLLRAGPPELLLGIDLSAEAADLAGGTARRLRAAFDLSGQGLEVRELRATLPGDADTDLVGHLDRHDPARPVFDGDGHIAAPDLRTTLAWLEGAGLGTFSALPAGVLRSADLAGHVRIASGQIALGELDGLIDGAHISGTAAARLGPRIAVSAGLRTERLDLDPWLPTALPAPASVSSNLRPFDVDLRLDAKAASAHGVAFAPFSLDAVAQDGRVTLRRLDLMAGDVGMTASGSVIEGGRIADLRLDMRSPQAEPLAALLPPDLAAAVRRGPGLMRSPVRIQVFASGPTDALGLRVLADIGDLHLDAQPTVDLDAERWAGPVTLRHPGAPRFAESLGFIGAPAWLGDGSLAVIATMSATPGHISADTLEVTAGTLHATGNLAIDRTGAVPRVTGQLAAESLPLPLPYPRSPDPLPIGAIAGWDCAIDLKAGEVLLGASPVLQQSSARVSLAGGVLHLDQVSARLGGGTVSGSLMFDGHATPPALAMAARVTGASIAGPLLDSSLDLGSGTADSELTLHAKGYSLGALMSTLGGQLTMDVRDGVLLGVSQAGNRADLSAAAVAAALQGGTIPFDTLRVAAVVDQGSIAISSAVLAASGGTARISGTIDLSAETADLRVVERPAVPDPPDVGLRLTGPIDELQRTPELADVARWRAIREASGPVPLNTP